MCSSVVDLDEEQSRDDIKNMKIDIRELRDLAKIRKVTKNSYKDLGDLLNTNSKIPIFGYPLICYSPVQSAEYQLQMLFDIQSGRAEFNEKQLWPFLSDSIYTSVRTNEDLLIKQLLDKYDDCNQDHELFLEKLTKGKGHADFHKKMSKR